jgi:glutamate carboxypeptidase
MMICYQLFEKIDSLQEPYADIWVQFAKLESPTDDKQRVDKAGGYLAGLARELGFSVRIFPQKVVGDVIEITMNEEAANAPVIFSGHIDTVHPVGSFGTPSVKIQNGKIYGPGVTDCKGGVVAALMAMHALRDVGFASRPVKLILQTDEEKNSIPSNKDTIRIMLERSQGAVAFLNCENTKENTSTAVLYRKGIVQYEFTVTGKAIHSSKCPDGISAINEAAHKIIELEKMKDMDGITANCGLISGGTADNTVPDECRFTADIRFKNSEDLQLVRETVRKIAEKSYVGGSCTVKERPYRPAMAKTAENYELLDKMNKIYAENSLPELTARMSLGGSDAAYTTDMGIPTVDSIGVAGDFIHTTKEYGVVNSLREAAKRLAAVAYCI